MQALFASGRIIDIIAALVVVELIVLAIHHYATGRGIEPRAILANLAAGLSLMLAVRAALVGAEWTWVAACLLAALIAHVADLASRFPGRAADSIRASAAGAAK